MSMRLRWFGQSAFELRGGQTVVIDPFGDIRDQLRAGGRVFAYPAVRAVEPDVLLVTHEHVDHNGVDAVQGARQVIRSTAGTFDTPIGEVVGIASEHDEQAGTARGANIIFRFPLDGLVFCHLGDLGQRSLREEQLAAIGEVDVLFVPVGGLATVGGAGAADVARAIRPRLVVPMHYRTPSIDFLEPPDAFLRALGTSGVRLDTSETDLEPLLGSRDEPTIALFAAPYGGRG